MYLLKGMKKWKCLKQRKNNYMINSVYNELYITSYYFVSDFHKHTLNNLYAITCISNFIPVSLLHTEFNETIVYIYIPICI